MKTLELDSVTKAFQNEKILQNFSLELNSAERLVILGPSGCGKTTVLRLIAGFIAPDAGTISLNGELASKDSSILLPPKERNVGMVFQDLALWPHLSVEKNIDFGLKAHGYSKAQRKEKLREVLELVELSPHAHKKPSELSGGEQQRVALARALAVEPKVLLMDEPLSSLDQTLNRHLRKEIIRLQETLGFGLIYVTHSPDEAEDIATRMIVMTEKKLS